MKRKKHTTTTTAASSDGGDTTTAAVTDLKALINEHSLFFDKLVELIPAKFYLPNEDDKPYFKGLSKIAKASLKQQTRENIKLSRRNRLDPEKVAQSSTLDLLKQSLEKPEEIDNDDDAEEQEVGPTGSVTYEELRQRLRRKIEMLRGNRGGEKAIKKENIEEDSDHSKSVGEEEKKKRKRGDEDGGEDEKAGPGPGRGVKVSAERVVESGIEFGKLRIGDEERGKGKKRKLPKAKELERVKRLEEMKKENPSVAKKESWKSAVSRAYGAKVHDDPKLLKESIKKEMRRRVISAENWKGRVDKTKQMKSDKQKKRNANIAERAKDKKDRKIAKREKKLMRPGFEGRKEGYISKT